MWANCPAVELITKGIPLLCLIVWLFRLPRDRFANLIMAGLIVSLVADLVMQWDKSLFVPGLLIFLVAQVIYIVAFCRREQARQLGAPVALCGVGLDRVSDSESVSERSDCCRSPCTSSRS